MLTLNYEFRKGIFFLRLIGELNETSYLTHQHLIERILTMIKFKYIVININYLHKINLTGLNYFSQLCYISQINNDNLIICDKNKILTKLLHQNIPNIKDEQEVL